MGRCDVPSDQPTDVHDASSGVPSAVDGPQPERQADGGDSPNPVTCEAVLWSTFDECLAAAEVLPQAPGTAPQELLEHCARDLAKVAFDVCCDETPDPTCNTVINFDVCGNCV